MTLLTNDLHDHFDMYGAWEKVQGRNFALSSRTYQFPNGGTREVPSFPSDIVELK